MSARRRRLILKPQARSDVSGALLYTREQWGADARARYKATLYRSLQELTAFPEIGILRDEIYPGCRSRLTGQHVIYYHLDDDQIIVVRLLHGQQDPAGKVAP